MRLAKYKRKWKIKMIELFSDISPRLKENAEFIFDMALRQKNLYETAKILQNFTQLIEDDNEREFVEFYFNMRMEQIKNDNNFYN